MLLMGGDRVEEAVAHAARVLRAAAGRDWGVAAGGLDWSCLQTAEHIAGDLVAYAGQLTGRATGAYVPFDITLDEGTDPEGAIRVIEATGGILASVVRTTPPGVRAYHPYPHGSADAAGFAAMGVAEVLLHTYDIARALASTRSRPRCCARRCSATSSRTSRPRAARRGGSCSGPRAAATCRAARRFTHRWHNSLSLPAGPVSLCEVSPAAAADLAAGGTGGLTWIEGGPFPGTRGAAGRVAKAYADGTHRPEWGLYALVRAEDGLAVGGMGFHGPPDEEGCLEVGYDLAEAARGHGHATAALRALSEWALARPGVTSLLALVDPENTASQGVLTRAGYARLADRDATWAYGMRRA